MPVGPRPTMSPASLPTLLSLQASTPASSNSGLRITRRSSALPTVPGPQIATRYGLLMNEKCAQIESDCQESTRCQNVRCSTAQLDRGGGAGDDLAEPGRGTQRERPATVRPGVDRVRHVQPDCVEIAGTQGDVLAGGPQLERPGDHPDSLLVLGV